MFYLIVTSIAPSGNLKLIPTSPKIFYAKHNCISSGNIFLHICYVFYMFYNFVMSFRNILLKLFLIFAFILNLSAVAGFALPMNISSVTYDNSGAFLSINTFDISDFEFEQKPEIMHIEEDKEIYFDLKPAILNTSQKKYIISSDETNQINISQVSKNPDIVRVSVKYNEGFDPANITLKKINNTIFLKFKQPHLTNYYFQEVYKESGTNSVFEKNIIQEELTSGTNTIGQINSAFAVGNTNSAGESVLNKKDLILKSKYFIDNLALIGVSPAIYGIGTYTLSKPMILSDPTRVVYDLKNAIVNPVYHNKEFPFGTNESIKVAQFDYNTARIVITTNKPEKYTPVIYADTQKLVIFNSKNTSPLNLYSTLSDMTGITAEKSDDKTHSVKFTFSKSVTFGINRSANKIELMMYNLNNYYGGAFSSEMRNTPFEKAEFSDLKNGGAKLSIPLKDNDKADVFLGADGKTMRIKLHLAETFTPKPDTIEPEIITPAVIKRKNSKDKYVVIDAGHGGSDCGAIRNNINEKDITLDIAKKVQKLLIKKGYIVEMTRTDDTYVSLQDRVEISEKFNPDIFVSIHVNSSNNEAPSGLETHYYKDNSLDLAKHMHAAMLNNINSKDRGLFKSKFYVINHTTAPAVLLEIGFLSNPSERAQLVTESRKNATAKAVVEGINEYFKH